MIELSKEFLKLPEQLYGKIKRVGVLNNEPILYGDVNLLRLGDLYYIIPAKLVYRYIKTSVTRVSLPHGGNDQNSEVTDEEVTNGPITPALEPEIGSNIGDAVLTPTTVTYMFENIKITSTEELMIPEEEKGTIRKVGNLFNKPIYSGDPNMVNNSNLYYHLTLPFVSEVTGVNEKGSIEISTFDISEGEVVEHTTEYKTKPEYDYSKLYLTFISLEDENVFSLTIPAAVDSTLMTSISYSINGGKTWITTQVDDTAQTITTPTINAGNKVLWKGVGKAISKTSATIASKFNSTHNFNISGNIMSLLYEDDFANETEFQSGSAYNFYYLFHNATKLISSENLILPATTLTNYCYSSMFNGCTSLTTALTTLPATTLAEYCYSDMFQFCPSLTTAPVLPALTLVANCYKGMFQRCLNLNYIKAMFTTTPGTNYTASWTSVVSPTGTFVKNINATWTTTGISGVPSGWTVETTDA